MKKDHTEKKSSWLVFWRTLIQYVVLLVVVAASVVFISHHAHHSMSNPPEAEQNPCDTLSAVCTAASATSPPAQRIYGEGDSEMTNMLIALISISAAMIVGFQIFNGLEFRNHIREFEKKLEDADKRLEGVDQLITYVERAREVSEKLSNVDRTDGDHSRMTAFLLNQTKKPTWAMGWLCRAIKSYDRAYMVDPTLMDSSYPDLMKQAILIEMSSINIYLELVESDPDYKKAKSDEDYKTICIRACGSDNDEDDGKAVLRRTFKDVIDSRIVVRLRGHKFDMQGTEEQENVIDRYVELLTCLIAGRDATNRDVEYAYRSSRYQEDFHKTLDVYKNAIANKSTKTILDELKKALDKIPKK